MTEIGIGPICEVDPSDIVLPRLELGSSKDTTFTISNIGFGTLIGNVSEECEHFSIVAGYGSFVLNEDQSREVTVRFEPTTAGNHFCTIETGTFICSDVTVTGKAYTCSAGDRLYVDADATGTESGASWTDAFVELRDALEIAVLCPNVSEIWVADGTYTPTNGTERDATFQLRSDLAVYGGFEGTEILISERDWITNTTILSGDIGIIDDSADNCYHVVTASGTNTVLD